MNETLQIIFSGVVAISTVVYAVLTWRLVTETKLMRQLQITPDINVFFELSEIDSSFVYLIVENLGYGIAQDVRFSIIENFSNYDYKEQNIKYKGVFENGVENFYPKQRFKYYFSNLSDNHDEKMMDDIKIKLHYYDITGKKYTKQFNLKLNVFKGIGKLTPPDSYLGRISHELNGIKSILSKNNSK